MPPPAPATSTTTTAATAQVPAHVASFVAGVQTTLAAATATLKTCAKVKPASDAVSSADALVADLQRVVRDGSRPIPNAVTALARGTGIGGGSPVTQRKTAPKAPPLMGATSTEELRPPSPHTPDGGASSSGSAEFNESPELEEAAEEHADADGAAATSEVLAATETTAVETLAPAASTDDVMRTSPTTVDNNSLPRSFAGSPMGTADIHTLPARPIAEGWTLTSLANFTYDVLHGATATGALTSSAGISELGALRSHGYDMALLVGTECLQVMQDYARLAAGLRSSHHHAAGSRHGSTDNIADAAAPSASSASASEPIPIDQFFSLTDATRASRLIFERIFLGLYSPRSAPPPPPSKADQQSPQRPTAPLPPSLDDGTVRNAMRFCIETVKGGIRVACLLQDRLAADMARSNGGMPPVRSVIDHKSYAWDYAVDTIALPLYYLLHVASDDPSGAAAGSPGAMPPIPNTIAIKSKSDARGLLSQLLGLAMKQCPGQRLGRPFDRMSPERLSAIFGGAPVAGFVILEALSRCLGDGEGGQAQLALLLCTDALAVAASDDPATVRWLFTIPRYSKSVASALVTGCLSPSVTMLGASLRATLAILKVALVESRQEMGFLHCNALLRLLDADNNHVPESKEAIVRHLAQLVAAEATPTMAKSSSSKDAAAAAKPSSAHMKWPAQKRHLVVDLFAYLDLDPRLHHANLVSQVVASLSRMVRTSTGSLTHAALATAAGGSATTTTTSPPAATPKSTRSNQSAVAAGSEGENGSLDGPTTLSHLALLALSRLTETLAFASQQDCLVERDDAPWQPAATASSSPSRRWVCAPRAPGNDGGSAVLSCLRDEKMSLQRQVDVINLKPEKLGTSLWGIPKDYGRAELGSKADDITAECSKPEHQPPFDAHEDINAMLPSPTDPATPRSVNLYGLSIARFLACTPSMSPASIGEYLSDERPVPLRAAYYFMTNLELGGRSVASALRELFNSLALPKEGQRIERILEAFSNAFYDANANRPDVPYSVFPFKNRDAAFVLIVATVMLHTDLHNPRVESKMNKRSFTLQLTRCNDNEDFPEGFASDIYDLIAAAPFNNAKGLGAVSTESSGPSSTQIASQSRMDFFFFSRDERKELLFTLERRRILGETKELVARKTVPLLQLPADEPRPRPDEEDEDDEPLPPLQLHGFLVHHLGLPKLLRPASTGSGDAPDQQQRPARSSNGGFIPASAVAKELFASSWGSLFAVFSVLLQQPEHVAAGIASPAAATAATGAAGGGSGGEPVAVTVLHTCVKGLQDLLYAAAAFGNHTEAEAALTALLRVPRNSPVRRAVIDAVFFVASSPFAGNLNHSCWLSIASLCAEGHEIISLAQKGNMSPAALAMSAGVGAVYSNIEAALRLSPAASVATNYNTKLADRVIEAVTAALLGTAGSDHARLAGLLHVLRNLLRAFAAADLANAAHFVASSNTAGRQRPPSHVLDALDALTGLFVSVVRVHAGDANAVATVSSTMEHLMILALGLEAQLRTVYASNKKPSGDNGEEEEEDPPQPIFGMLVEVFRCVQASSSSPNAVGGATGLGSSGSGGGNGPASAGGTNGVRVRIAVMRTMQSLLARCRAATIAPAASKDEASVSGGGDADPLATIAEPMPGLHGRLIVTCRTHANMLGAVIVEAASTAASGLAAELRTMATMALNELTSLAAAVADLPPADDNVAAASLVAAVQQQRDGRAAAASEACCHRSIVGSVLPIAFVAAAFAGDALAQLRCAQHATALARRATVMALADDAGVPAFDATERTDVARSLVAGLEILMGSPHSDTRAAALTACQWLCALCAATSRPGAATKAASAKAAELLMSLTATMCAATTVALPARRAREVIDDLSRCSLMSVPSHVIANGVPNVSTPATIRNSASFTQLLVLLSCDVFGVNTGPRFDPAAASKAGMPVALPWRSAQALAATVIERCITPLLKASTSAAGGDGRPPSGPAQPAPVTAQSQAAKCLTRILDRSLTAFGGSSDAHEPGAAAIEANFVLAALADALEAVRIPKAILAAFLRHQDGTTVDDLAVFSTNSTNTRNTLEPASEVAAAATTQLHRSGHVTAEEAAAAYHAFACVGGSIATYAANMAHRAAPLPDVPALSRLIQLALGCADDVVVLHEDCPQLLTHSAFANIRTRPLYHAPASMLHWCLVAGLRLMFARWRIASSGASVTGLSGSFGTSPGSSFRGMPADVAFGDGAATATATATAAADGEGSSSNSSYEALLHGTTVRILEAFTRIGRSPQTSMSAPVSDSTNGGGGATPTAARRGSDSAGGGEAAGKQPVHAFRGPLAECIRDWGCLISASCQRVATAAEVASPARGASQSPPQAPTATPPQWPVLRQQDVFLAAVGALMVPECPAKVVAAVARYLTLFHSAELLPTSSTPHVDPEVLSTTPGASPAPAVPAPPLAGLSGVALGSSGLSGVATPMTIPPTAVAEHDEVAIVDAATAGASSSHGDDEETR